MPGSPVPLRSRWAAEMLAARDDDRILELGCGHGHAACLIAGQLGKGHVTAVDRSERAVERASQLGAPLIADGRLTVRRARCEDLAEEVGRYDKVFAVNVNLFWTQPQGPDIGVARRLLRPGGELHVFYEVPDAVQAARTLAVVSGSLGSQGLRTEGFQGPGPALLGVRGTCVHSRRSA